MEIAAVFGTLSFSRRTQSFTKVIVNKVITVVRANDEFGRLVYGNISPRFLAETKNLMCPYTKNQKDALYTFNLFQ